MRDVRESWPMRLLRPKASSKRKPTTVGGKTSGRVKAPSIQTRARLLVPYIALAASTPRTKVKAVATPLSQTRCAVEIDREASLLHRDCEAMFLKNPSGGGTL